MSTNSQDSVAPLPASSLFQSFVALPNRIFDAVDLASLLLAMKSSLAIVLTIGIAFWLGNINAGIGATTALMIQMPFAGSTIQRGIMRFVGGITGWLAALVLLALFSQDRVLFIGSMSIAVGVWVFFMQGSRYFYAYLLGAVSMVLIGYGSVENPLGSFEFGGLVGFGNSACRRRRFAGTRFALADNDSDRFRGTAAGQHRELPRSFAPNDRDICRGTRRARRYTSH